MSTGESISIFGQTQSNKIFKSFKKTFQVLNQLVKKYFNSRINYVQK